MQKYPPIVFKDEGYNVLHGDKGLIMSTKLSPNRMLLVSAPVIVPTYMKVTIDSVTHLWYCRYGYLSFKGLDTLNKKDMAKGVPSLKVLDETCSYCLMVKQQREAMPKYASWRAKEKLELIHSDVCGPIKPTSNGVNRYFIIFTYDFSRKSWVYFLK